MLVVLDVVGLSAGLRLPVRLDGAFGVRKESSGHVVQSLVFDSGRPPHDVGYPAKTHRIVKSTF